MALISAVACFAFVTLVVLLVAGGAVEGASVRSTMEQLVHYADPDTVRMRRRSALMDRVLGTVAGWMARIGPALTTAGQLESTRRRLVSAGRRRPEALARFLSIRALGILLLPVWALVGTALFGSLGLLWWAVLAFIAMASVAGPDAALNRAVAKRQQAVRASLPEVLDLLTISVEAGFGLEQALERVATDLSGPLSDELRRVHGELRAGSSWSAAMHALSERVDVPQLKRFTLAITQADSLGVPIAPMLRAQSEDLRVRRRQLAQESAQKAPVKMLLPMVFCVFPALFVVVIGPAFINLRHALG